MMSASLKPWLVAARPRTLPLAIAAIALGTFLAAARAPLNWPVTLFTFLTALLLQILSNFANDYGDFVHGADVERQGPLRAVQGGLISREAMLRAMLITAIAAAVSGLAMLILAFGGQRTALILLFVALGGAAIWAAVAYTATSKPYGYVGLGDLFVLIFFGWVGAMGAYFLQTGTLDFKIMLPATAVGLLSVGVLNINNIRDIESDPLAGKISIPVRIGRRNAQIYHLGLLVGAVLAALHAFMVQFGFPSQARAALEPRMKLAARTMRVRMETPEYRGRVAPNMPGFAPPVECRLYPGRIAR